MSDRSGLYDAFASYAHAIDRDVVRDVERFLESLHENPLVPEEHRVPIELCVDGSDFKIPPARAKVPEAQHRHAVFELITHHLKNSARMLVFVGPESRKHPWITLELQWWLQNRPGDEVRVALTHGPGARPAPATVLPQLMLDAGLDSELWFDLRDFRRSTRVPGGRLYEEERLRIAAWITGKKPAELVTAWKTAKRARRRRNLVLSAIAAGGVALLATGLFDARRNAELSANAAVASSWESLSRLQSGGPPVQRLNGLIYAAAALMKSETASAIATTIDAAHPLLEIERTIDRSDGASVFGARFVKSDAMLLSAGRTGRVELIEVASGTERGHVDCGGHISALEVAPDRRLAAAATSSGLCFIGWSAESGSGWTMTSTLSTAARSIYAVAFAAAGDRLFAGTRDGELLVYEPSSTATASWRARERHVLTLEPNGPLRIIGLGPSPDGASLIVAGIGGELVALGAGAFGGRPLWSVFERGGIFAFARSSDGSLIAITDRSGGVQWLDAANGALRGTLKTAADNPARYARVLEGGRAIDTPREEPSIGLAFSGDGNLLAVASQDHSVRLFELTNATEVGALVHRDIARTIHFAAGDRTLVAGGDDGRVSIARVDGTVELLRIAGVERAALSPDGAFAAIGDQRGVLRVVSTTTGEQRASLPMTRGMSALAFAPNGEMIVAGGASTKVERWKISNKGELEPLALLQHQNKAGAVEMVSKLVFDRATGALVTGTTHQGRRSYIWTNTSSLALPALDAPVWSVAAGSGVVASTALKKRSVQIAAAAGARVETIELPAIITASDLSDDGTRVAAADGERNLCLCDLSRAGRSSAGCNLSDDASSCEHVRTAVRLKSLRFVGRDLLIATSTSGLWTFDGEDDWTPRVRLAGEETNDVDVSPRGEQIAVAAGRTVWVFAARGAPVVEVHHPSRVHKVTMLDSGLLGVLDGTTFRVWKLDKRHLLTEACARWPQGVQATAVPGLEAPFTRAEVCGVETSR